MENTYPIKVVSLKSGLTIHTIRAWEKRYQTVTPTRTETNRRYYTDDDIEKLTLLNKATSQGFNISGIAQLSIAELNDLLPDHHQEDLLSSREITYINASIEAIKELNTQALDTLIKEASMELNMSVFTDEFLIPLIEKIGELWHQGNLDVMHEHMATAVIKSVLSNMRVQFRPRTDAPTVIVTTPLGQIHELGAQILAMIAASKGMNVIYLGVNLPAEDIIQSVIEMDADALLLSIVYPYEDEQLKTDLEKLITLRNGGTRIIVGGAASDSYDQELKSIGAQKLETLTDSYTMINMITQPKSSFSSN